MKCMTGYYCTGSAAQRSNCSGYCKTCGYGRFDTNNLHKDEEYYVPPKEDSNPTYVPSYRSNFIPKAELNSGKVSLY